MGRGKTVAEAVKKIGVTEQTGRCSRWTGLTNCRRRYGIPRCPKSCPRLVGFRQAGLLQVEMDSEGCSKVARLKTTNTMPQRPRYEDSPSKLLIYHLEQMFPGFRDTPEEWRSLENTLRGRYEDQPRKRGSHLSTLPDDITLWSGKDLRVVLMEPPAVVHEPIQKAKKDSRRGKKKRPCGLTCTEMLLLLAESDSAVLTMKPPEIRRRMIERWDKENPGEPKNALSIRTIQEDRLYRSWQQELVKLRKGLGMSVADFQEEGLVILSHKPGREDKRREGRSKGEQAYRTYVNAVENKNIHAKRQIEAKKAAPGGSRQ